MDGIPVWILADGASGTSGAPRARSECGNERGSRQPVPRHRATFMFDHGILGQRSRSMIRQEVPVIQAFRPDRIELKRRDLHARRDQRRRRLRPRRNATPIEPR